jgi:CubicO group peptidase (beta-lactamase class C family)
MLPRDMAKFGYLYLNNGTWDGEQIIPHNWVQQTAETLVTFNDYSGYSYQWWTYPTDIVNVYSAQGFRGQYIFVIPSLDMVVVFTSSVPPYEPYPQPAILFDYIIPAAMYEIPQQETVSSLITISTLVFLPLPFLAAVVYFRIRTRRWFWKPITLQELQQ